MKRKICFLIGILLGFFCYDAVAQSVPAKNDTLYFEDQKVFVPKYPTFTVTYSDSLGNVVDIKKCPNGTYVKEYVCEEFRIIEFYRKADAEEKK